MSPVDPDGRERLMLDPSLVLSPALLELVEEARYAEVDLVVSATFVAWLGGEFDLDPERLVAREDLDAIYERRERASELLTSGTLVPFSADEVDLGGDAREVLDELRADEDPVARIDADQWAYLQSNSWLGSKLRRPLDAFRDAGAVVIEAGQKFGMKLMAEVIPAESIPPNVTRELVAKATVKWLVVGGAGFGGGTLGGALGTTIGGPVGGTIGHVLVGKAAKRAAKAAVLAIDP